MAVARNTELQILILMWAADILMSRAWHVPPCLSIVCSTDVFLTHVILQVLVYWKSTPTGGDTPSIWLNFLSPLKVGPVTGIREDGGMDCKKGICHVPNTHMRHDAAGWVDQMMEILKNNMTIICKVWTKTGYKWLAKDDKALDVTMGATHWMWEWGGNDAEANVAIA